MTSNSFSRAARAPLAAALLGVACFVAPALAQEEEACAPPTVVDQPPPALPDYDQPPLPGPGYLWSPGYWAWDADETDYYWVPGTWTQPPRPGLLWTPGYWGWVAGAYVFHPGYWGSRVGFYGGVDYGFGYSGQGYEGGRWDHGVFFYNRSVNNFGAVTVRNVYEQKVDVNDRNAHVSFNGGKGGVEARPSPEDRTYARQPHFVPTPLQRQHVEAASKDPALFQKTNHGAPAIAATPRPAEFKGPGVAPARAAGTPPGAPANGASPAAPNRPGGEERKSEERKPAGAERPELDQKKPPASGEPQPGAKPTPPATPSQPAAGEKRPVTEEREAGRGKQAGDRGEASRADAAATASQAGGAGEART